MSDVIEIERGHLPWRPTSSSELVSVLHRYNHPLMGVIRQPSGTHFFECATGCDDSPVSVWSYCHITEHELGVLETLDVAGLQAFVFELLRSRACVIALAVKDEGIAVTELVEDFSSISQSIRELFSRFALYRERVSVADFDESAVGRDLARVLASS